MRVYSTAGILSAGAFYADSGDKTTGSLTFDDWIAFLEAKPGKDGHGAALCMSPSDYAKIKTAMQEACQQLGGSCTTDSTPIIANIDGLVTKTAPVANK